MKRLIIFNDKGVDISNDVTLEGKANPFGWSQHIIKYRGETIGYIESGEPMDFHDGYSYCVKEE